MNTTNTTSFGVVANKQPYSHLHRSAIQIQSQWRGHKTRKLITDWAMKEFENIVMEIEGKDSEVSWNSSRVHSLPIPFVNNSKLSEDENDLDRILSSFVNRNEVSPSENNRSIIEKPANQSTIDQRANQQEVAQKLFEEKENHQEPITQKKDHPQVSNTGMNTSIIESIVQPKITREQEIQTETLRASMNQSFLKDHAQQPQQPQQPQNRRLVTVSTNTSIAFDGIPKIQEQKTQDLSIEIPLEDASSVQSQEDLSEMLNESAIMMSNLDLLKSFDFSEMKKSSESNVSNQAPTKSKEPQLPQQQNQAASQDIQNTSKQSQEMPPPTNTSNRQSLKSTTKSTVSHTPSPNSSQTSEKLQHQKAKQELQQQISMLRYEIQLAEEAYTRRKKELIEERKRQR